MKWVVRSPGAGVARRSAARDERKKASLVFVANRIAARANLRTALASKGVNGKMLMQVRTTHPIFHKFVFL